MPTLIFFRNGKRVDTIVGADVPGLREKVARALASGALQFSTYEATKEWSIRTLARSFPGL